MSNYDIITEHELYLKVEKKYSINTINTYITNISSFSEFVNKNFKNVEEEDIKKYLIHLNKNNISFIELGGVQPNPINSHVLEGIKLCKENNVDLVLAIGGGSVIDSAKSIADGAVVDLSLIHI